MQSFSKSTRLVISLDVYEEKHRERGGLTLPDFRSNPRKTTRFNDHFALSRYAVAADLQHNIQPCTDLSLTVWFAHLTRLSWRQQGGGFGNTPNPLTVPQREPTSFRTNASIVLALNSGSGTTGPA